MTNKIEMIKRQANQTWSAMSVGLDMYGISPHKDYTDVTVNNSIMVLSYTLKMRNTSKWRKLKEISVELGQMAQLKEGDQVRISYSGLSYRIEVPKPRELHNTVTMDDTLNESRGLSVGLGMSAYNNDTSHIRFDKKPLGHVLVAGSTQCGKTNILKLIATSLMIRNSPDNLRLAFIDTVRCKEKYGSFSNSAHLVADLISSEEEAITFLSAVKEIISNLNGRKFSHKVIIFVDEMYILQQQSKTIAELLRYIATAGAGDGFHLVMATQYTAVDNIGGSQLKGNLMTRVVGQVSDWYASLNSTGVKGAGAEALMAPGDFIVASNNTVNRIAVPEVQAKHISGIERGMTPIINTTNVSSDIPVVEKPLTIPETFDKLDPRLLHLAIHGKRKGKRLGIDSIMGASVILSNKGIGNSIGKGTARQYVQFAKKYREKNNI